MKVGSAEGAPTASTRAALEENDGAFADVLGGVAEPNEEPVKSVPRRQLGAEQPTEDPEVEIEMLEIDIAELPEGDADAEVRILTEPKRTFWERAANTASAASSPRENRALTRPVSFDVQLFERQASQPQNDAVVPGPRSVNVPPLRPMLSAADAALPSTVRPSTPQPESPELKQALRAPALPDVSIIDEAEPVARARPAPSPPMSVTLQLATIAHDVLARAAQLVAADAPEPQAPMATVAMRPVATQVSSQDAFIHIEHPVLGQIRLQLVLDARNLSVRAVATNAAAVAALRESEESMREDIARHGVDLETLRVDLKRRARDEEQ